MNILVTGGAGYIGSHTCKELARQGHDIAVYDNLNTGHRDFARWGDFFHGDILDTQRLRACMRGFRPDGVIHFAASSYVGESVENPGKYFRNNVAGTLSLLEAMRDEGVPRIVVSGTCSVYGCKDKTAITEACPVAPENPYAASKLFMERMLADFHSAHGLGWMSLRYFNAAGNDPEGELFERHDPETHLIPRAVMAAFGRIPELHLFGDDYPTRDGTCIRDYIHVSDLARAHILALEHIAGGGENMALNLGSGEGYSVNEVCRAVEAVSGKAVPRRMMPRRPGDPPCLVANATRAAEVLRWECACSDLETIIRTAIQPYAS